jgi:hypothetical protein
MENMFSTETKDGKNGRKWLLGLLETEVVEIEFTKKDGTDRVMKCTLQEDYLPEVDGVIVFEKDRWKKDSLAVFDIEKEGWRSFRWDSVKAVRFTLGD